MREQVLHPTAPPLSPPSRQQPDTNANYAQYQLQDKYESYILITITPLGVVVVISKSHTNSDVDISNLTPSKHLKKIRRCLKPARLQ